MTPLEIYDAMIAVHLAVSGVIGATANPRAGMQMLMLGGAALCIFRGTIGLGWVS